MFPAILVSLHRILSPVLEEKIALLIFDLENRSNVNDCKQRELRQSIANIQNNINTFLIVFDLIMVKIVTLNV